MNLKDTGYSQSFIVPDDCIIRNFYGYFRFSNSLNLNGNVLTVSLAIFIETNDQLQTFELFTTLPLASTYTGSYSPGTIGSKGNVTNPTPTVINAGTRILLSVLLSLTGTGGGGVEYRGIVSGGLTLAIV